MKKDLYHIFKDRKLKILQVKDKNGFYIVEAIPEGADKKLDFLDAIYKVDKETNKVTVYNPMRNE